MNQSNNNKPANGDNAAIVDFTLFKKQKKALLSKADVLLYGGS